MNLPKTLLPLLAAPLLLSACGEPEDTRPGQPVAHRQQAFKAILKAFEPMGMQLRKNAYDPDRFLAQAQELERIKDGPWAYFAADTHYPPTKATEKVWSDPAAFTVERDKFLLAVSQLQPAAASRDPAQAKSAYQAVEDSCRSCHKSFKR